jgi:hypothetical protein
MIGLRVAALFESRASASFTTPAWSASTSERSGAVNAHGVGARDRATAHQPLVPSGHSVMKPPIALSLACGDRRALPLRRAHLHDVRAASHRQRLHVDIILLDLAQLTVMCQTSVDGTRVMAGPYAGARRTHARWTALRLRTRILYSFPRVGREPYSGPRRAERGERNARTSQGSAASGISRAAVLGWFDRRSFVLGSGSRAKPAETSLRRCEHVGVGGRAFCEGAHDEAHARTVSDPTS